MADLLRGTMQKWNGREDSHSSRARGSRSIGGSERKSGHGKVEPSLSKVRLGRVPFSKNPSIYYDCPVMLKILVYLLKQCKAIVL